MLGPRRPGHERQGFAQALLLAEAALVPAGPNVAHTGRSAAKVSQGLNTQDQCLHSVKAARAAPEHASSCKAARDVLLLSG